MSVADLIAGPQGDLIGLTRWLGVEMVARRGDEAGRDLQIRMQSPTELRRMLAGCRERGYLGILSATDACLFEALGRGASRELPIPTPIVPNLGGLMREAVEYGMVGAGMRRAWRVGPLALAGLGLRSVGRAPALLKRDFPTLLRCFVELELADFARFHPPVVFLQPQMTDLALAMHNPRILEAFIDPVRERLNAEPGLMTHNFGALTASLKSWGIEVAAIVTPWDAVGHRLRPDRHACRQAAKGFTIPIWSDRQGCLGPPSVEERAVLTTDGLTGVARDDPAVWCDQ